MSDNPFRLSENDLPLPKFDPNPLAYTGENGDVPPGIAGNVPPPSVMHATIKPPTEVAATPKQETLLAYMCEDEHGVEYPVAMTLGQSQSLAPLIAYNNAMAKELRRFAEVAAATIKRPVTLVEFKRSGIVDTIQPPDTTKEPNK